MPDWGSSDGDRLHTAQQEHKRSEAHDDSTANSGTESTRKWMSDADHSVCLCARIPASIRCFRVRWLEDRAQACVWCCGERGCGIARREHCHPKHRCAVLALTSVHAGHVCSICGECACDACSNGEKNKCAARNWHWEEEGRRKGDARGAAAEEGRDASAQMKARQRLLPAVGYCLRSPGCCVVWVARAALSRGTKKAVGPRKRGKERAKKHTQPTDQGPPPRMHTSHTGAHRCNRCN